MSESGVERILRLNNDEIKLVHKHFDRKYCYKSFTNSNISKVKINESTKWKCDKLQDIKRYLNSAKDKLNHFDIIVWHAHTRFTHKASDIIPAVKKVFQPEVCTQAWCKFREIMCKFPHLLDLTKPLNSFHLCEAPGAFVTSLNFYLVNMGYQSEWQWRANTLNPLNEGNDCNFMIENDVFIQATSDKWCFGWDDTGDITNVRNIDSFREVCHKAGMNDIHLVTCDGSIDCANDPASQEEVLYELHYAEVVAALSLLAKGGSMILKVFTMFESSSVSLLHLLSCHFQQLTAFKPATSKPGNSELYLIATGFTGIDADLLHCMKRHLEHGTFKGTQLFDYTDIPMAFLEDHTICCQMFSTLQHDTIHNNIASFEHYDSCSAAEDTSGKKDISSVEMSSSSDINEGSLKSLQSNLQTTFTQKKTTTTNSNPFISDAIDNSAVNDTIDKAPSPPCANILSKDSLVLLKKAFVAWFFMACGLKQVSEHQKIVPDLQIHIGTKKHTKAEKQRHRGSLLERQCELETPVTLKLMMMPLYSRLSSVETIEHTSLEQPSRHLHLVHGKRISQLRFSKFCSTHLLSLYLQAISCYAPSGREGTGQGRGVFDSSILGHIFSNTNFKCLRTTASIAAELCKDAIMLTECIDSTRQDDQASTTILRYNLDYKSLSAEMPFKKHQGRKGKREVCSGDLYVFSDLLDPTAFSDMANILFFKRATLLLFLEQLIEVEEGACVVCRFPPLLTRMSCHLLRLLSACFHQLRVHTSCTAPLLYIFCKNKIENSDFRYFLSDLKARLIDKEECYEDLTLLSFMHHCTLQDGMISERLCCINNNFVKTRINFFICLHK